MEAIPKTINNIPIKLSYFLFLFTQYTINNVVSDKIRNIAIIYDQASGNIYSSY